MRDGRYEIIEAKAGDWVEGVLSNDAKIVAPMRDEHGVATVSRQECCDAVLAELRRRAAVERNRLTRRRSRG